MPPFYGRFGIGGLKAQERYLMEMSRTRSRLGVEARTSAAVLCLPAFPMVPEFSHE